MIIFFKKNDTLDYSEPVVLLDYTRSDDQFSFTKIQSWVARLAPQLVTGAALTVAQPSSIFSLRYEVVYRHSAVNYGDSLKTSTRIVVHNAPAALVSLVQLQQVVSAETALSLGNAETMVVDAQNQFAQGALVHEIPGPIPGVTDTITRLFMVYGTTYNLDPKRLNSTLEIRGAGFDSMVMRLRFKMDIVKEQQLIPQIQEALAAAAYELDAGPEISELPPVVARYYPPAPLNVILANVCRDNGMFFDIDETTRTITLHGLTAPPAPPYFPPQFSFRNMAPTGTNVISGFAVRDYAAAVWTSEIFDASLFDTLMVYDDSGGPNLFDNFRSDPVPAGIVFGGPGFFYPFYLLEYALVIDTVRAQIEVIATNNWLVSNFKLETLFENAVYGQV